jgi:two-component system response regulator AtoC
MRVLIADDEKNIRDSMARFLRADGIEAVVAADGAAARALLEREWFDGLVLDLRMPEIDGLTLLAWMREAGPQVPTIVISAYADVRDAVQAMKLGARDYLVKPFDPEELLLRLRRLLAESRLSGQAEAGRRAAEVAASVGGAGSTGVVGAAGQDAWLGDSERMRDLRALAEKVAPTPSTVLITGESGTGKEVIARFIHARSAAAQGPFVPINIGSVPDALLESELFGYERGAFTGAAERKRGMLELASSGTLFLDEIGDMPLQLQVKLLRVLQERTVQRLGGTQPIPINARIIAATNRELETLLKEGKFREDLYYRLNVIRIETPPLRERREDIPRLAGYFIGKLNREMGRKVQGILPDALARLQTYHFPGNVRELENRIERAFIMCTEDWIATRDLGEPFASNPRPPKAGRLKDQERELIEKVLAKHDGNRTKAAVELGISRRTLLTRLKEIRG